jgi:DNA invertase Pin-like site-specific DNA recombinase
VTESMNRDSRAVMYLRVAPRHLRDTEAISHQREACQRIAAKRGLCVVREYIDLGTPALLERQTALQRLLADLSEHRDAAHVVIWDYARLAQDMTQLDEIISQLRVQGADVVTMTGVEVAERFIHQQVAEFVMDEAFLDDDESPRPPFILREIWVIHD